LFGLLTLSLIVVADVGQQRAELVFDKWLLLIAYVGVHAAIAFLVMFAKPQVDISTILVLFFLGVMLFFRARQLLVVGPKSRWRHALILLSTLGLLIALARFSAFQIQWSGTQVRNALVAITPTASGLSNRVYIMAAAASVLPVIFYNFVDFSFWQKYQSEMQTEESDDARTKRLRKPLLMYVFESPLSWLLPVILGIYAVSVLTTDEAASRPIPAIADFIYRGTKWIGPIIGVAFYAGLVAIAVSTACGYLVSTAYLYKVDISKNPRNPALNRLPLIVIGMILLALLLPIDMLSNSIDQVIVLMLASFAPLCALTPLVMYPLITRQQSINLKGWALQCMVIGVLTSGILGFGIGVLSAIHGDSPAALRFWLPMPLSFIAAWIVYLICVIVGKLQKGVPGDG
jgi:hypothetical protein